ncbi:MAG: TlpA family protein disulfide reductase [Dehalococcoidia bacterium]
MTDLGSQPRSARPPEGGGHLRRWRWIAGGAIAVVAMAAVIAALRSEQTAHRDADIARDTQTTVVPSTSGATSTSTSNRYSLLITAYQGEEVLGGREVDFAGLLGQGKPVVLNFWAGLCPPCRAEMPALQQVYEEYKGAFILVGVDVGDLLDLGSEKDARALLEELKITYPAASTRSDPFRNFEIRAMPTTFFFAADGSLATQRSGLLTETMLRRLVDGLLASSR